MIIVFIIGYIMIATEHKLQIDKAAVALLTAGFLWIIYILFAPLSAPVINPVHFQDFVNHTGNISSLPLLEQCRKFIVDVQIVESLDYQKVFSSKEVYLDGRHNQLLL